MGVALAMCRKQKELAMKSENLEKIYIIENKTVILFLWSG